MLSLTSPPDCSGCFRLSQKIAELEGRISNLYQIQEDERLLDSLATEASCIPDNNTMLPWLDRPQTAVPEPLIVSSIPEEDSWPRLGAKPKRICSTPAPSNPWITVRGNKKRGKNSFRNVIPSPGPIQSIQLGNSFEVLGKLEQHLEQHLSTPPFSTAVSKSKRHAPLLRPGSMQFTPRPTQSGCSVNPLGYRSKLVGSSEPAGDHIASRAVTTSCSSKPPLYTPTSLIVGDSIVRHIKSKTAVTHCVPGAKIVDVLQQIPGLLSEYPYVRNVIIHVGTNDTTKQQSEALKQDFNHLFNELKSCGKSVFISGPIPTFGRGIERFSRLLSFNTWLHSVCPSHNLFFIDNFNLFWERSSFFSRDGIHPSFQGTRALSANIFHALKTAPRQ